MVDKRRTLFFRLVPADVCVVDEINEQIEGINFK